MLGASTIGIAVGTSIAVFACLLFLTKRPLSGTDRTVAAFMALLALPMLEKLVLLRAINLPYFGHSVFLGSPLAFGPFLYLYARRVVRPGARFQWRDSLHFVPFLLSVATLLVLRGGPSVNGGNAAGPAGGQDPLPSALDVLDVLVVASLVAYTVLVTVMLRAHRRKIPDYFSRDSIAVNLKWLDWLTASFSLAYGFVVVATSLIPLFAGQASTYRQTVPDIGTAFFVVVFGFCAIKQPVVFKAAERRPPEPASIGANGEAGAAERSDATLRKYGKSGLKEAEAARLLSKLEEHMRSARPWLDPELTIEDLASALGVQRHHVTQVVNALLHKNFYRFVNEYRIAEVKRKLDDGEAGRLSLLGIAMDSGFNSKSTFNDAFRKITGLAPSEYRKSVQA
jgi:AraC-like DNA-binding protein